MRSALATARRALGQYFTTDPGLQNAVCAFVRNNPETILEPSVGRGDLVRALRISAPQARFDMHEIDSSIEVLPDIDREDIVFGDFMTHALCAKTYSTIAGNPPFVRTRTGNLYVDFIAKCFRVLSPGGELVFVVPSDFFRLTCAAQVLAEMMRAGTFTDVFHPNRENLFADAAIDVLVFRYCMDPALERRAVWNGEPVYVIESGGLVTFDRAAAVASAPLRETFDVLVGHVSGNEKVFKNAEFGNVAIRNSLDLREKYILLDAFPTENSALNAHMLAHRDALVARGLRKFDETNWYQFGLPRNAARVAARAGEPCVYVHTLTRREAVAFTGVVEPFGGALLMLLPKTAGGKVDLARLAEYFNSSEFRSRYLCSGRFKMGQRVLAEARVSKALVEG